MNRRTFLTGVISAVVGAAAYAVYRGYVRIEGIDGVPGGRRTIGEPAEFDGMTVIVSDWDEAKELEWKNTFGDPAPVRAPENAVLVLAELSFEIVGDEPRDLPSINPNLIDRSSVWFEYNGDKPELISFGGVQPEFRVRDDNRRSYKYVLNENPGDIYPDASFSGWIGCELSDNYSPEELAVVVEVGGTGRRWWFDGERPVITASDGEEIEV